MTLDSYCDMMYSYGMSIPKPQIRLRNPEADAAIEKMVEIYMSLELKGWRNEMNFEHHLRYNLYNARRAKFKSQHAKEEKQNERRREARKTLDKRCEEWIEKYGFAGLYIKVVGSRDGRGYREIISMDAERKLMKCYQLDRNGERTQIVEIMFNKFRGLLHFGEYVDAGPNSFRRAYIKNIDELEKMSEQAARNVAMNHKWRGD